MMIHTQKWVSAFFLTLLFTHCWVFAQPLVVTLPVSSIGRVFGDPCRYRVRVTTRASGPSSESVTAFATMTWNGSGPVIIADGRAIQNTGTGQADATFRQEFSMPVFGRYFFTWLSSHWASSAGGTTNTFIDGIGRSQTMDCQYFAGGDDPCEPEGGSEVGCFTFPFSCKNKRSRTLEDCMQSPVLIDLGADGFRFGAPGVGTFFDLLGNGTPRFMQWVKYGENDAFLVHDLNGNGIADDGSELFGNGTRLLLRDFQLAPNGFVGLSQFDDPGLGGDDDGYITPGDEVWHELGLWLDENADGVSVPAEMSTLEEYGISALAIVPFEYDIRDSARNWLRYWAYAFRQPASGENDLKMVDVFFLLLD